MQTVQIANNAVDIQTTLSTKRLLINRNVIPICHGISALTFVFSSQPLIAHDLKAESP